MDIDNLVRMANRIGDFYDAMPNREEALQEIATHLRKFWEPRMRREILAHVDLTTGGDLSDIVREAITRHRQLIEQGLAAANSSH
jgi:NADH-dependant formate dehydrogenase delta subunit FdsD.